MVSSEPVSDRQSKCPVCDKISIDSSFDHIDGFCIECGFVIQQERLEEAIDELRECHVDEVEKTDKKVEWTDYYKVRNGTEQRIATALEYLEFVADRVELSSELRLASAEMYAKAAQQGVTEGRRMKDIVGGIVCLVTRQAGEPVPIGRIARQTGEEPRSIGRVTKQLQRELEVKNTDSPPEAYVEPLCRALKCDSSTVKHVIELIRIAQKEGLVTGQNPVGIAAAAIYSIERGEKTQREIAEAAGVSRETVRKRVKEFSDEGIISV